MHLAAAKLNHSVIVEREEEALDSLKISPAHPRPEIVAENVESIDDSQENQLERSVSINSEDIPDIPEESEFELILPNMSPKVSEREKGFAFFTDQ